MNLTPYKKITELSTHQYKSLEKVCNELDTPNTRLFYTDGSKSPTKVKPIVADTLLMNIPL